MTISSEDFLESAEKCLENNDEVGFRNAVSRGYYAVYHEVSNRLTCLPNYSRNKHSALIDYLKSYASHKNEPFESLKLKSLGQKLNALRLERNEADYDIDCMEFNREMAEQSLILIRKIFDDFKQMNLSKTA